MNPEEPTPPNAPAKRPKTGIIVLVTIVLLLLTNGAMYYWQHKQVTNLNNQLNTTTAKIAALNQQLTTLKKEKTPDTPSSSTGTTSTAGYDAAKQEWLKVPSVNGSAQQNVPLNQAITDLTNGLKTDKNTADYTQAIAHLRDLTTIPVSDVSDAQRAQGNSDIQSLDTFFNTPNLWSM